MSRLLVVLISLSLGPALVHASQAAAPGALSGELRTRVQNGRFGIVSSIRGLPLGVRYGLQDLFGSTTLDIVEPDADVQLSDPVATRGLPSRRLVAAGCTADSHCLVYYERGGAKHTWHVALFHWTPDKTQFEWGSTAPGGLKTLDEVRKAILSGAIKGLQPEAW